MPSLVEKIYRAAANAGFLKTCLWQPGDGRPTQTQSVGFFAPDKDVLSGLGLSTEYEITYPSTGLVGLKSHDVVQVDAAAYQVREVMAVADGSELRATLMRV